MITTKCKTKELMISADGYLYTRELSLEEQAEIILRQEMDEELKIEKLQKMGFELEEILDLAFKVGDEDDNR